jgi:uncharacterized protein (TIGR02594 family)
MTALGLNSRGLEVVKLQLLLDGHLPSQLQVKADGVFGPHTRNAVIAFQKRAKLTADGIAGPETLASLGLSTKVKSPSPPVISPALAAAAPWMTIAAVEMGVHRDMAHHHEKRIIEYLKTTTLSASYADTDSTAWCSAFINWVVTKSGRTGTNNALAASWLNWKHGQLLATPRTGAIVVIQRKDAAADKYTGSGTGNHVGFCMDFSTEKISFLGGNQGNRVSFASFSLTKWNLRGAMWPNP